MKSIFRKYIFWFKEFIYGVIIAIFTSLSAYYLGVKTTLPTVCGIILVVLIFLILIYINLALEHNFYNPLCTYEIDGKLIDSIRQYDGLDNVPSYNNFSDIVTIEYIYKNKKYRRMDSKIKIKICKFCPKIVHIEDMS